MKCKTKKEKFFHPQLISIYKFFSTSTYFENIRWKSSTATSIEKEFCIICNFLELHRKSVFYTKKIFCLQTKRPIFQVQISTCRVFPYNSVTSMLICELAGEIISLQTKRRPLYLKTQSVPRCKHFSSRL
jgi:hypothetical protein